MSLKAHPNDMNQDDPVAEGSCSYEPALSEGERVSDKHILPSFFSIIAHIHPLNFITGNQGKYDEG